jgi:hypothetical protein
MFVLPPCSRLPGCFYSDVSRLLRMPLSHWFPYSRRDPSYDRLPTLDDPAFLLLVACRRICCLRNSPVCMYPGRQSSLHLSLYMPPAVAAYCPPAFFSPASTSYPSLFALFITVDYCRCCSLIRFGAINLLVPLTRIPSLRHTIMTFNYVRHFSRPRLHAFLPPDRAY